MHTFKVVLIFMATFFVVRGAYEDDVIKNWCRPVESYDSYSMILQLMGVSEIGEPELDLIIDRTLLRAGCTYQLLNSSDRGIVNCSECITAENIYQTLRLPPGSLIIDTLYDQINIILATFLSNLPHWCVESQTLDWSNTTLDYFIHRLLEIENSYPGNETHEHAGEAHEEGPAPAADEGEHEGHIFQIGQLEYLMRHVAASYIPGSNVFVSYGSAERNDVVKSICSFQPLRSFNSREISSLTNSTHPDEGVDEDDLGRMSSILITRLAYGECISEVEQDLEDSENFIRSLFQTYAEDGTCDLDHEGLERIAAALNIGELTHDHAVQSTLHDNEDEHHHANDDVDNSATEESNSKMIGNNTTKTGTGKSRRRRATIQAADPDHGHERDVNETCVTLNDMMKSFHLDSEHPILSKTDLMRICPALIQQSLQGCPNSVHDHPTENSATSAEAYGYGTLAVFIVSLCSFIGLIIVRWQHTAAYRYIMSVMLGLGVGSLVGDALLHLIPHALGLHDHSSEDGHNHAAEGSGLVIESFTWKMLCACASIWFYYNLQLALYQIGNYMTKNQISDHHMSVVVHENLGFNGNPNADVTEHFSHDHNNCELKSTKSLKNIADNADTTDTTDFFQDGRMSVGSVGSVSKTTRHTDEVSEIHHAHTSVAWMITLGDGIHNFADGLAMGAAFSQSWKVGLSTTIAIFTHELPHEFGDTAIMLSSGWSVRKVALCQILSQATAFIGLYIGIAVSDNTDGAQQWIFSITCGLFLYVALASIIPELVEYFNHYKPWLVCLTSNIGMLIGFGAMLLIAIYEEKIVIT